MMAEVRGTRLPNPPWKALSFDRVIQYYDGPRLILQKSQSGQLYLAWWSDSDDSSERWIYLPLSEARLHSILSGETPSLDGLRNPEDGHIFVVDIDLETDSISQTILTDASALPSDALPLPEARLHIAVPEEISGLPTRERAHTLDVRIESLPSDKTGRIGAKTIGQFLGNLQRLVDSLGQAMSGNPTTRSGIPGTILNQTRLDPVGTYSGSFGIRLETNQEDDLFGMSLVNDSLEGLFDLLAAGYQAEKLTDRLTHLKVRVAKNYRDLLSTIETSLNAAYLTWSQPRSTRLRQDHITRESARNIIAQIEAVTAAIQEDLSLDVTFVAGNIRNLRFEVHTLESNERFDGIIHEQAIDEVERITLGSSCRAILEPNLQVNEATGEERTTYTLLSITQL